MAKERAKKRSSAVAETRSVTARSPLGNQDKAPSSNVLLERFKRGLPIFTGILLFIVVGCVFLPALRNDFVQWDDDGAIYQNPHLKGLNMETLRWMFADLRYVWRYAPMFWLTREIIYDIQGLAPFGYHLVSLVVHSLNAVWLFLLLRKLLPIVLPVESKAAPNACRLVCPAFGALLWAVHPLRVEPVAW